MLLVNGYSGRRRGRFHAHAHVDPIKIERARAVMLANGLLVSRPSTVCMMLASERAAVCRLNWTAASDVCLHQTPSPTLHGLSEGSPVSTRRNHITPLIVTARSFRKFPTVQLGAHVSSDPVAARGCTMKVVDLTDSSSRRPQSRP